MHRIPRVTLPSHVGPLVACRLSLGRLPKAQRMAHAHAHPLRYIYACQMKRAYEGGVYEDGRRYYGLEDDGL